MSSSSGSPPLLSEVLSKLLLPPFYNTHVHTTASSRSQYSLGGEDDDASIVAGPSTSAWLRDFRTVGLSQRLHQLPLGLAFPWLVGETPAVASIAAYREVASVLLARTNP